ncbi:hypothetical protein [Yoonia sediminilitoris]|uniref:Uncharacterized protein n=1 Tax=Yoonia sediminilitoris TaxID=1286148 RepID=A0A2T6KDQ9_9RHOB|nr:hypothetical protein [Yoonia sediminilitoris]PUB13117.1 hypothetical protein C8N45_10837 [Yoonia sediminilitoris]RCW94452.1 hypothetical protein DFP92_10838 [Yoonia sediminilitoris]
MALLAVMLVLFGLNIILLLPCWIIGVWLYGWVKAAPALSRVSGLILTILPVVIYAGALSADVPEVLGR